MQCFICSYISSCKQCVCVKVIPYKPYSLLQPLDIPNCPWCSGSMDFITKLPHSRGYDFIWVICNRVTHTAHLIPVCESMLAPELAQIYLDQFFCHHGYSESIILDCGSVFVSSFFSSLMHLCRTKMHLLTTYHPQTDGLMEHTNQTLETYFCVFYSYNQDNWVDYLVSAKFLFNNSINSSTQKTPSLQT